MSRKARKKKAEDKALADKSCGKRERRKFVCSDPLDLRAQEILKELSEYSKYDVADIVNDSMNVIRDLLSQNRTLRGSADVKD